MNEKIRLGISVVLFIIAVFVVYGVFLGFGAQCAAYFDKPSYEYEYCVSHRSEGTPMYQIIEHFNGIDYE